MKKAALFHFCGKTAQVFYKTRDPCLHIKHLLLNRAHQRVTRHGISQSVPKCVKCMKIKKNIKNEFKYSKSNLIVFLKSFNLITIEIKVPELHGMKFYLIQVCKNSVALRYLFLLVLNNSHSLAIHQIQSPDKESKIAS